MRRCSWVLALAGCAARPSPTTTPVATPRAVAPAAPTAADPSAPPCPAPGWLTPEALIGPWRIAYGAARGNRELTNHAKRDDYLADGTVQGVRLVRRVVRGQERWDATGGSTLALPTDEQRADWAGTWSVDPTGLLERRWSSGERAEATRERVWLAVEGGRRPHARLRRRPLVRGADEVWRAEVSFETTIEGVTRSHHSRVALRFDPPLRAGAPPSSCAVVIDREIEVRGGGRPRTWTDRARGACTVHEAGVDIEPDERLPGRWPDDARLQEAHLALDIGSHDWLAPDVLTSGHDWEPQARGRPVDPPILWHDAAGLGACVLSPRAPDLAPPAGVGETTGSTPGPSGSRGS